MTEILVTDGFRRLVLLTLCDPSVGNFGVKGGAGL